jgi:acyl-homoserine-lactone acylase
MRPTMHIFKPHIALLAALSAVLAGCASPPVPGTSTYDAEIRRTDYGIPHIRAADHRSLAYGLGYAYAQDNACLLFDQLLTVRAERSRHFGAEGQAAVSFRAVPNLDSDFYFALTMDDDALRRAYAEASPQARDSVAGYAAGVNRFLRDTPRSALPAECRDAVWVRPISEADVYRLLEEKATQAGAGAFAQAITSARPPAGDAAIGQVHGAIDLLALDDELRLTRMPIGSNGWAFGSELGAERRGVLLGNPHFPWTTSNRFYQSHLTIPGELDVMGVSLGQFPVINIGFNHDVAWTHTVSTARRFTLFALQLVPGQPTRYVLDGQPHDMVTRNVTVEVRQPDGHIEQRRRTLYLTPMGPVLSLPQAGLAWSAQRAFALADANRGNARMLDTWLSFSKARTVDDVKAGLSRLGMPWVNTVAADRDGRALYADISAVPAVDAPLMADCAATPEQQALFAQAGLLMLDGSRSACAWRKDAASPVPGLLAVKYLPVLQRSDFVANSNDSYWLANPAELARGLSPIIGRTAVEQGLRTRMGLMEIKALSRCRTQPGRCALTPEQLRDVLFANRNLAARLVLDDLLPVLRDQAEPELRAAAAVLGAWERDNRGSSRGAVLFHEWWLRARTIKSLYRVPFDPADPVHTPRGLNTGDADVVQTSLATLGEAVRALQSAGFAPDVALGSAQTVKVPGGTRAVPGGDEREGVLNRIDVGKLSVAGYRPESGSTYIQAVGFSDGGPHALGLLIYGQSSDPASPHYYDQLTMFANHELPRLPFTPAEIKAQTRSLLKLSE